MAKLCLHKVIELVINNTNDLFSFMVDVRTHNQYSKTIYRFYLESRRRENVPTVDYTVPAIEAGPSEVRASFETNVFAIISICKTFLPLLMKAKGTIVQTGSVAGVSELIRNPEENSAFANDDLGCSLRLWFRTQRLKCRPTRFSDSPRVELAPFGYAIAIPPPKAVH